MRRVFYSFHYKQDNWRVNIVRNMGVVDGTKELQANEWEQLKQSSDKNIKTWIDNNLRYRSCTVVLIGEKTAERKWVQYEIKRSWEMGKGVIGVYIHNLKDSSSQKSRKGDNPFVGLVVDGVNLGNVVPVFDPIDSGFTSAYDDIKRNLASWVEAGIRVRKNCPGPITLFNVSSTHIQKSAPTGIFTGLLIGCAVGFSLYGVWAYCNRVNGVNEYYCPECGTRLLWREQRCPYCKTAIQW